MISFLNTLKTNGEMNTDKATALFGWDVITKAYNKGRITFEGSLIVFVQ